MVAASQCACLLGLLVCTSKHNTIWQPMHCIGEQIEDTAGQDLLFLNLKTHKYITIWKLLFSSSISGVGTVHKCNCNNCCCLFISHENVFRADLWQFTMWPLEARTQKYFLTPHQHNFVGDEGTGVTFHNNCLPGKRYPDFASLWDSVFTASSSFWSFSCRLWRLLYGCALPQLRVYLSVPLSFETWIQEGGHV